MKRLLLLLFLMAACNGKPPELPEKPIEPVPTPIDPFGERPELAATTPFRAPQPEVFQTKQGITVWLLTKPALPVVSFVVSLPVGSADDPPGKAGLASVTANMLDEGAGDRGAIEISTAIEDVGGSLSTSGSLDGSYASVTVLKKHIATGFSVFADVISRPRFEKKEWKRVTELWHNQLKRREDSPAQVARLVARSVAYGPDTPYGHPTSGLIDTAKSIELKEAKAFYKTHWRPDRAVLIAAGDIDRPELEKLIDEHLSDWKKPASKLPDRAEPPKMLITRPKLVLVDRPKAPQSVIYVVLPGIAAADADGAALDLLNTALGGSFTSRLNQNLREDKAWSYGAGSAFLESRGQGLFLARAAVRSNVTAAALKETLGEIDKMAKGSLSADEYTKVRARDLTELIQSNESINSVVWRLGSLATLGLPPDHDTRASAARQKITREQLAALAAKYFVTSKASIVVVGPKAEIGAQLKTLDMGDPEAWTPNGYPAKKP